MLLKACINGARRPGAHPALPLDEEQCAQASAACVEAGAGAIHVHPRDAMGHETLDPDAVDDTVIAIRAATDVPVGVSTGAWIEPDMTTRVASVHRWAEPDFASVNVYEEGALEVTAALLDHGIGIEAGLSTPADVARLMDAGMADGLLRVLIEPTDEAPGAAVDTARAIAAALDAAGVTAPRLAHGAGVATWAVIEWAVATGYDIRIGLEDTLVMPDGRAAEHNASLCEAAAYALPA